MLLECSPDNPSFTLTRVVVPCEPRDPAAQLDAPGRGADAVRAAQVPGRVRGAAEHEVVESEICSGREH